MAKVVGDEIERMSPDIEWRVGEDAEQETIVKTPQRKPPRRRALAIIIAVGLGVALGVVYRSIPEPAPRPAPAVSPEPAPPQSPSSSPLVLGPVSVSWNRLFVFVVALALIAGSYAMINRTKLGKAMRATAADREAAEMMGISSNAVIVLTFVVGSSLGAVAGILYAINYNSIDPYMGFNAGMKAFAAAVLGGIGNIYGAMLGGLLLGVFEGAGAAYVSSMYRDAVAFAILILALIFRPEGLLGEFKSGEKLKAR